MSCNFSVTTENLLQPLSTFDCLPIPTINLQRCPRRGKHRSLDTISHHNLVHVPTTNEHFPITKKHLRLCLLNA